MRGFVTTTTIGTQHPGGVSRYAVPGATLLGIVVVFGLVALFSPEPWRTAFRGWLRALLLPEGVTRHLKKWRTTGVDLFLWIVAPGAALTLVARFLPKAWTLTVLFIVLFVVAVLMGVRVQKHANDAARIAKTTFAEMSDGKDAELSRILRREDERVTAVVAEYEAKLAAKAAINLRYEHVPSEAIWSRFPGYPNQPVFLVTAIFHNEGPASDFKAVVVNRSLDRIEGPTYPNGDFHLRWQTPNIEDSQPIIHGGNGRVDVAYICPGPHFFRFLGPQGVEWAVKRALAPYGQPVSGLIELHNAVGERQRWEFVLSVDASLVDLRLLPVEISE